MISDNNRFEKAIAQFDAANSLDPNQDFHLGKEFPKELLYAERMSKTLATYRPDASEALQLAARSQHIRRWTIPRDSYPMDRKGYLLWRSELKRFHADQAAEIMGACGYDEATIDRVRSLVQKHRLKTDPEVQILEDVICLVFLEHYFNEFAGKHEDEKVVSILKKTWSKMSEEGRKAALSLDLNEAAKALINQAIT